MGGGGAGHGNWPAAACRERSCHPLGGTHGSAGGRCSSYHSSCDYYHGCASDHGSPNDDRGYRSSRNYDHGRASDHGSTNDDRGYRSSRNDDHGCANDHGSTNDDRSDRQHHGNTLGDNIRRAALSTNDGRVDSSSPPRPPSSWP